MIYMWKGGRVSLSHSKPTFQGDDHLSRENEKNKVGLLTSK